MGGPGSGRWRNHQRKQQVEECLAFDLRDLGRLGILKSEGAVAGRFVWKDGAGTLLGSATYRLGPVRSGNTRELLLRLSEELDPSREVQVFKLERVVIGCAPRGLLLCPECGKRRARRLFLPPKGTRFACRWCHNIMYRSVQKHDHRIDRIVQRLRAGDFAAIGELSMRGQRRGHTGLCADRLLLSGLLKAFPKA